MTEEPRKVTATWPNETSLTGFISDLEDGGASILFGHDNQWSVLFRSGTSRPIGELTGFEEAVLEWEEPSRLGAIIEAHVNLDDQFRTWIRVNGEGEAGLWQNTDGEQRRWREFDNAQITVKRQGIKAVR